jgi:hypothetical protein
MDHTPDSFNRVHKLLVDREGISPEEAAARLSSPRIALAVGPEVADSPTLQAAVLTAANAAVRCFGGEVMLNFAGTNVGMPSCLPGPETSLATVARSVGSNLEISTDRICSGDLTIAFGSRPDCEGGLQATFDGWYAQAAPIEGGQRLRERERCVLAGVAAGALAVSELFFQTAGLAVEAGYRAVNLSLWRPDRPADSEENVGPKVTYLPKAFWFLGLGHLGQAYGWNLGMISLRSGEIVEVLLNDPDRVVEANLCTGMLSRRIDLRRYKTHVVGEWLERRGYDVRHVDRRFDEGTKRQADEPGVALCGFDGSGPRELLEEAGFEQIVECGLGGSHSDFDSIFLHTMPDPEFSAERFWAKRGTDLERVEGFAASNPFYRNFNEKHGCGAVELAGKSVAVPFVGSVAGALVLSEAIRMMHGGMRCSMIELSLQQPVDIHVRAATGASAAQIPRGVPHAVVEQRPESKPVEGAPTL